MKISQAQGHVVPTPRALAPANQEATAADQVQLGRSKPTLLQRAGDRVAHAGKNLAMHAGLVTASSLVPLAVTGALSAALPGYVAAGGMVGNMVIGGAVGAAIGHFMGKKICDLNGTTGKPALVDAMALGGAMGAFSGFMGVTAGPGVIIHDPKMLALMGLTYLGVSAATVGTTGFLGGLWHGPPR
jgi:hypothetical protein